jgi:ribonuclease HII
MPSLFHNFSGANLECGTDEAGRGCLAGPVVAAAVILPEGFECPALNDSKQLTEKERNALRPFIEQNAIAWAVGVVDNIEIDRINILNASILAMHKAIQGLSVQPQFIISDGNRFKPFKNVPHQTIVKGDGKYLSIAAASVLAKTHRDELMQQLHAEYPHYDWDKNKAYPTLAHRKAIALNGTTLYHRMSFNLTGDKEFYELKKAAKKAGKKKKSEPSLPELEF